MEKTNAGESFTMSDVLASESSDDLEIIKLMGYTEGDHQAAVDSDNAYSYYFLTIEQSVSNRTYYLKTF